MKPTELMIGDWVYDNYHKSQGKVTTLTRALLWVGLKDNSHWQLKYDEVEPIPLNAEILERNGFKRSGTNYIMADDYYDIVVHEISDSIWDVQYTNCEMPVGNQQMCVCHVHQLQHALRMCDENIKIEL